MDHEVGPGDPGLTHGAGMRGAACVRARFREATGMDFGADAGERNRTT